MTPVTTAKLILAACGLVIWGYGIRSEQPLVQYVGIGTMVAAVLIRFLKRPPFGGREGTQDEAD